MSAPVSNSYFDNVALAESGPATLPLNDPARYGITHPDYDMLGKYQMSTTALKQIGWYDGPIDPTLQYWDDTKWTDEARALGINSRADFLANGQAQEAAMRAYTDSQWDLLKAKGLDKYITEYTGSTVNGIEITATGLLAGAHLKGPTGVERFIKYGIDGTDADQTPVSQYIGFGPEIDANTPWWDKALIEAGSLFDSGGTAFSNAWDSFVHWAKDQLGLNTGSEYAVQGGDTLSSIAALYMNRDTGQPFTWQELAAANPNIDPNVIYPGDVINIPYTAKRNELTQAEEDILSRTLGQMSEWANKLNSLADKFFSGIRTAVSDFWTDAQRWIWRRDPLTLDLDGDGLETVGINPLQPILFDHDADGIKTGTGWISPDDGFLVLDRNGNGEIDDGAELFGDSTPLNAGGTAADGFAALAQEDTNNDGRVDSNDANFNNLRVWRDLNQDGISQADELLTLTDAGIASINVAKTENNTLLPNGNVIADLGSYTKTDGTSAGLGATGGLGDIDLREDTFHSQFTDPVPITPEAQVLPNMQGSGQVRDLREAASLSPALASALAAYSQATTRATQLSILDTLIYAWSDTSSLQGIEARARDAGYTVSFTFGSQATDLHAGQTNLTYAGGGGADRPVGHSRHDLKLAA